MTAPKLTIVQGEATPAQAWRPTARTAAGRMEIAELVAQCLASGSLKHPDRTNGSVRPPAGKNSKPR